MGEPVEVRIHPHHHDGDVIVGHMEFPQGDPGGGSSQSYSISAWNEVAAPPDGNMVVGPLATINLEYLRGFEFEVGQDRLLSPEGTYFVRSGLRVDYDGPPPTSGFVYISLSAYWNDIDGNEMESSLITLQATSANPPDDPVFDATIAGSQTMEKLGLGILQRDGRIQLEVTNNCDIPVYVRGQLVIAKV